ncbi:torsin-1A-interacting protein 2-like isoform X2 [Dunckerocampus dactyliophorus]|uniref:torsin-1A-interacting protein 2-like isoform X2 n=1 Tax=Dunckerocampus dactyliophorus TaxID=161453 RepID=UPI002405E53A|nr:torsin-1A-interacting protein 2-like isoform X2 [Dunckerocampus dactyliophorus]
MEDPDRAGNHRQDTAGAEEEKNQSTNESAREGDRDQAEERSVPLTDDGWSQGELGKNNVETSAASPPPDHGRDDCDDGRGVQRDEAPAMKAEEFAAEEDQPRNDKALEEMTEAMVGDTNYNQVDGPTAVLQEDTNNEEKDIGLGLNTGSSPEKVLLEEPLDDLRSKVETIGPTTQEAGLATEVTTSPGVTRYLIALSMVVLVAILVQHLLQPEPPLPSSVPQIDIFLKEMDKVKTRFPHQRPELWSRSRIHLKRHLLAPQPSEPVSLILTAGVSGRRTLRCLAHDLASAFSTALNATVLHIDCTSKVGEDSDQVKLDIDGQLQRAFEGDKPVAVIHRFEQLPPGSTLIFYRYCDHENAAYKKTFLIFTVLLEDEEEIPVGASLSSVEEMVDDHLQRKFLSHDHPMAFDRMDLNKYGGLWSRISHLILPVVTEGRTEEEGC